MMRSAAQLIVLGVLLLIAPAQPATAQPSGARVLIECGDNQATIDAVLCGKVLTQSAAIANGASLSGAIDLGTGSARLARIVIPAGGWTAANLTFQSSADCATYGNLRDASGNEYTVTVSTAGDEIIVPYADFIGIRCLKIRSGTSGSPVNQGGARTLVLVLVP